MADELTCDMCGESFDTEEEMKRHAREEHGKEM